LDGVKETIAYQVRVLQWQALPVSALVSTAKLHQIIGWRSMAEKGPVRSSMPLPHCACSRFITSHSAICLLAPNARADMQLLAPPSAAAPLRHNSAAHDSLRRELRPVGVGSTIKILPATQTYPSVLIDCCNQLAHIRAAIGQMGRHRPVSQSRGMACVLVV
jgi:hypothetical protein